MTQAEARAQAALQQIVGELETIHFRLTEVLETLPATPSEETENPENEEDLDVATEVRSTIECVLDDSIRPALRDLRTVATYRPKLKDA